jgi:hypothetical protein
MRYIDNNEIIISIENCVYNKISNIDNESSDDYWFGYF